MLNNIISTTYYSGIPLVTTIIPQRSNVFLITILGGTVQILKLDYKLTCLVV